MSAKNRFQIRQVSCLAKSKLNNRIIAL